MQLGHTTANEVVSEWIDTVSADAHHPTGSTGFPNTTFGQLRGVGGYEKVNHFYRMSRIVSRTTTHSSLHSHIDPHLRKGCVASTRMCCAMRAVGKSLTSLSFLISATEMIAALAFAATLVTSFAVRCDPDESYLAAGEAKGRHRRHGNFNGVYRRAEDSANERFVELMEGELFKMYEQTDYMKNRSWVMKAGERCEETSAIGEYHTSWGWIKGATFEGNRRIGREVVEVYGLAGQGFHFSMACLEHDPKRPVWLKIHVQDFEMEVEIFNWVPEAPKGKLFDLPRECPSSMATSNSTLRF